jgi:creatinine amidohydrolase
MMVWLDRLKWPDIEAYLQQSELILLPVGSTEQHGMHAPLGTDTLIAAHLAEDAAIEAGVLCAPPLPFGWSPHHMVLPGTINIRANLLQEVLFDITSSLAEHGFKKFIVVNGHRVTNIPWIQLVAEKTQRELGAIMVIFDPAFMQKEIASDLGFGPLGHADELETSQLLFLSPELVNLESAIDSEDHIKPLYQVDPRYLEDTLCYVPSSKEQMEKIVAETGGSTGKPKKSDVELGQRLHKHLVKRLVEVIELLR